jgi:flagellar biosynthesis/type III secretory pathway protein FliH
MIAERYLAKRFRQGKREGMAQGKREGMALGITEVLDALDEDRHAEVRRRLRRKGYADFLPADE